MKIARIFFLIFLVSRVGAQEDVKYDYPESLVDIGVGVGNNYGLFGAQAVIGYKGSGLLIAGGQFDKIPTYFVGVQISLDMVYLSFGYGVTGKYTNLNTNKVSPSLGTVTMLGVKGNIDHKKRFFLQLGMGLHTSSIPTELGAENVVGMAACLGLGYRISFKRPHKENRWKW